MDRLSETERIEILMMVGYGDRKRSYKEVCMLFNQAHPNKNINKSTVAKTLKRFNDTGNVKNRGKIGRPKVKTDEQNSLNILIDLMDNPKVSVEQIALNHGMCRRSVQKILKKEHFHPYKVHLLQEINEDDFDRRLEFCEIMMERLSNVPNFASNIIFSDEATFCLNGHVNRHNSRYWADSNPHWMEQVHTQRPQKVNVWAGIVGRHLIGPFFIEGTLTADRYLRLLQDQIIPQFRQLFPNFDQQEIWFQHDGAPPHYGRNVREYLDNVFPNKWIGRRGAIEWPARSPDLTPLDFFLWGHLKSRVYIDRPRNLDDLQTRIRQEMDRLPRIWLENSIEQFVQRLHYCQEVNGEHFEHLL